MNNIIGYIGTGQFVIANEKGQFYSLGSRTWVDPKSTDKLCIMSKAKAEQTLKELQC